MKSAILLLAVSAAVFSSCTTAYKTGQTPDDVYFSPAPPQDEYVQMDNRQDRRQENTQDYYDDRYLHMKVQNRRVWSELDDYYYYDNRYNYYSYNNWNNPWNPAAYWNYTYNPYCYSCCVIVNTKSPIVPGKPRLFNLNSYNNFSLTNSDYNKGKFSPSSATGNNSSSGRTRNTGNFLRNLFSNNNNSSNNNSSSSPRTSGSSSSGSSGSSSSGGSAPVRRF